MIDVRDFGLEPKVPEAMDSSMLKTFMDCPSQFYLRYVLGLKRKITDPSREASLDWGTCWHTVMEVYNETGSQEEALRALEENYPSYITPSTDRMKRSKARMVEAFFGYLEKWEEQDRKNLTPIRNEQFFDILEEESGLRWCGRIDRILRWKDTDRIVVWDYKTSSAMGDDYFDQHETGVQLPGYVWAASHLLGEPVREACIDVLYMTSRNTDFRRKTFRYNPARLEEWKKNIKKWISRVEEMLDKYLYFPEEWHKNWNECLRYGKCPFFSVHSVAPIGDVRMRMIQSDFDVEFWNPLREETT